MTEWDASKSETSAAAQDAPRVAVPLQWVWDPRALRIVLATEPAAAFWGEASVDELLDREFSPQSDMVRRLAEITTDDPAQLVPLTLRPLGRPVTRLAHIRPEPTPSGAPGLRIALIDNLPPLAAEAVRLREITEALPSPLILLRPDGTTAFLNQHARQSFGLQPGQAFGSLVTTNVERLDTAIAAALGDGAASFKTQVLTRSGPTPMRLVLRRIWDAAADEGKGALAILLTPVVLTPVSSPPNGRAEPVAPSATLDADTRPSVGRGEFKRGEIERREEGLPDVPAALAIVEPTSLRCLELNETAKTLLGDAAGSDGLGVLMPQQREELLRGAELVLERPGASFRIDATLHRPDEGKRRLHLILSARLSAVTPSQPPSLWAVIFDVTHERRKRASVKREAQLRARALEAAEIGIVLLDREANVQSVDSTAAALLGTTAETLSGRPFGAVLGSVAEPLLRAELEAYEQTKRSRDAARTARPFHVIEQSGSGEPRPALTVSVLPADPASGNTYAAVVRRYQSAATTASAALNPVQRVAMRGRAESRGDISEDAIALVSHELRTPLTTILGFVQMLQADLEEAGAHPLGPERAAIQGQQLKAVHETAQSMAQTLEALLTYRALGDRGALPCQPTAIRPIIEAARQTVQPVAAARSVAIRLDCQPGLPVLSVNPITLRLALTNMLQHAVRSAEDAGTVSVTVAQDDDTAIAIEVADDGPGMTRDEVALALLPFGRLRSAQSRLGELASVEDPGALAPLEALGLELPVARRYVEANGGSFQIESIRGVGTVARAVFRPATAKNIDDPGV
ncbi:MAG: ATP-binding protein [Pseudomonadota bacterium]